MEKEKIISFSLDHRIPLIIVEGLINDSGPYRFVVDTGASMTIVSPTAARRARIRFQPDQSARSLGVDGARPIKIGIVDSLQIGGLRQAGLEVGVASMRPINLGARVRTHGILGYNFLRFFTLSIDYADEILRLEPNRLYLHG